MNVKHVWKERENDSLGIPRTPSRLRIPYGFAQFASHASRRVDEMIYSMDKSNHDKNRFLYINLTPTFVLPLGESRHSFGIRLE